MVPEFECLVFTVIITQITPLNLYLFYTNKYQTIMCQYSQQSTFEYRTCPNDRMVEMEPDRMVPDIFIIDFPFDFRSGKRMVSDRPFDFRSGKRMESDRPFDYRTGIQTPFDKSVRYSNGGRHSITGQNFVRKMAIRIPD